MHCNKIIGLFPLLTPENLSILKKSGKRKIYNIPKYAALAKLSNWFRLYPFVTVQKS